MTFTTLTAALGWYYHQRATGGVRALNPEPREYEGGGNPGGQIDRAMTFGVIGAALGGLGKQQKNAIEEWHTSLPYKRERWRWSPRRASILLRAEGAVAWELRERGVIGGAKKKPRIGGGA